MKTSERRRKRYSSGNKLYHEKHFIFFHFGIWTGSSSTIEERKRVVT